MAVINKPGREPIKWNEHKAQNELASYCIQRQHQIYVPNFQAFPYFENDLASITKAGLSHVFEIKCSRSDFLKEFGPGRASRIKSDRLNQYERRDCRGANYFWLVCPENIIKSMDEIPEWAGVIWLHPDRDPRDSWCRDHTVERTAPRLHGEKANPEVILKMGHGLGIRYWDKRRFDQING